MTQTSSLRSRLSAQASLAALGTLVALALPAAAQTAAPRAPAQPAPRAPAAAPAPTVTGVWIDDTGRGAVEIVPCGKSLCGRIAWLLDTTDAAGNPLTDGYNPDPKLRRRPVCGLPVLGDLKLQTDNTWDEGWVYDPKVGKQYSVQIYLSKPNTLIVVGYKGLKFLSKTLVWTRAPADLQKCVVPPTPDRPSGPPARDVRASTGGTGAPVATPPPKPRP